MILLLKLIKCRLIIDNKGMHMNSRVRETVMKEIESLKSLVEELNGRINRLADYVEATGTRDLFED